MLYTFVTVEAIINVVTVVALADVATAVNVITVVTLDNVHKRMTDVQVARSF